MTGGRERIERRLAAIFAADVAGYSHLMGQDEVGTLRTLTAHREVMDGLIAEHGGRIANTAGDSAGSWPRALRASWRSRTSGSVEPLLRTGSAMRLLLQDRTSRSERRRAGDGLSGRYPASMPLTSARQVIGPTIPSTATEGTSSEIAC